MCRVSEARYILNQKLKHKVLKSAFKAIYWVLNRFKMWLAKETLTIIYSSNQTKTIDKPDQFNFYIFLPPLS